MTHSNSPLALAALTFALPAADALPAGSSAECQLLPAGPTFRATDGSGRPADASHWRIDAALAAALIARFNARANPRVIDYEHQTLGEGPAPAAGWFKGLEWREGEGLYATGIEWTSRAAAMLKAGEYRYISPVFSYAPGDGAVLDIQMAALTNNPGLDGMKAAALKAAQHFFNVPTLEGTTVELKTLLAALGLPETSNEDAALTALAALKAKADEALANAQAKESEIAALKAATPVAYDPTKHVGIEVVTALQAEIVALKAATDTVSADAQIEAARNAGKVIPDALAAHLKSLSTVAMKAMLDAMPATAGLTSMQSGGRQDIAGNASSADQTVMAALGQTPEQFARGGQKL